MIASRNSNFYSLQKESNMHTANGQLSYEQVTRMIAKLLKVAEHANTSPEEAANAAAKAQDLMSRYKIERTAAQLDASEQREDIINFADRSAPLDDNAREAWRGMLAVQLCKYNACAVWRTRGVRHGKPSLQIIGRPSDVEAVRYLYALLTQDVDALTDRHGKGCGKTWRNNFRIGVVEAIAIKLQAAREALQKEVRDEASRSDAAAAGNPRALVRINRALERILVEEQEVATYVKTKLKLRSGGSSGSRFDPSARAQGREAGKSITINKARGGLPRGGKAIRG